MESESFPEVGCANFASTRLVMSTGCFERQPISLPDVKLHVTFTRSFQWLHKQDNSSCQWQLFDISRQCRVILYHRLIFLSLEWFLTWRGLSCSSLSQAAAFVSVLPLPNRTCRAGCGLPKSFPPQRPGPRDAFFVIILNLYWVFILLSACKMFCIYTSPVR